MRAGRGRLVFGNVLAGCRRAMLPTEVRMADMLNDILLRVDLSFPPNLCG